MPAAINLTRTSFHRLTPDLVLTAAFCILTVLLVLYPIGRYLLKPWAFRRDRLFGLLAGDAIHLYYQQFRPGDHIPKPDPSQPPPPRRLLRRRPRPPQLPVGDPRLTPDDYMRSFCRDFNLWYGRQFYIAPLIGLALLSTIASAWSIVTLWRCSTGVYSMESVRGLIATSLAGAFVWIISDEIDRLRRRDFTSSDLYYYLFRLLLCVPFGWSLTRFKNDLTTGIPIAFFLGAFPTRTLFTAARRIAAEWLKLGENPDSGALELEKLPTIAKDNAERFKDEGITTISQLAYSDPVDLTIRTNFDFNYVIDCVSQALLWIYIPQVDALNLLSIRGAQEVAALVSWIHADPNTKAKATLQAAAKKLDIPEDALFTTLYQVALDPYTQFLVNAWASSNSTLTSARFDRTAADLKQTGTVTLTTPPQRPIPEAPTLEANKPQVPAPEATKAEAAVAQAAQPANDDAKALVPDPPKPNIPIPVAPVPANGSATVPATTAPH